MKAIMQSVGVDISKNKFDVVVSTRFDDYSVKSDKPFQCVNTKAGFKELISKLKSMIADDVDLAFYMEATGSYYENLAYFLYQKGYNVHVILPNMIYSFGKSFNQKAKTDKIDARIISVFGLERYERLTPWTPPSPTIALLKKKSREHQFISDEIVKFKVRLKNLIVAHNPDKTSIRRLKKSIQYFEKQLKDIESEMNAVCRVDEELDMKIKQVESIDGVGKQTIIKILSETNGFNEIRSRKQLASYAGLDVRIKESGQMKGKGKLTKKGNHRIRKTMYMPALTSVQYNDELKQFYQRLVNNGKPKKLAVLAVARKLLLLIFTIWKSDREYDPMFYKGQNNVKIT